MSKTIWVIFRDYGDAGFGTPFAAYDTEEQVIACMRHQIEKGEKLTQETKENRRFYANAIEVKLNPGFDDDLEADGFINSEYIEKAMRNE